MQYGDWADQAVIEQDLKDYMRQLDGWERLEPFQMQIDWPRTDDAAAGQRDARFFQTAKQRPGDADGAAHLANEVVVAVALDAMRLHGECVTLELHRAAEGLEDAPHELHVAQVRHAPDHAPLGGEQRRRHDR